MKWSWRIATAAGIGIYVHATFLLLLAYIVFAELTGGGSWLNVLTAVGFIAAVFTIVVLHELGHALAARRYGIRTEDITLLPIGGVARLERIPKDPMQELVVALAGPAVNVVLALACVGIFAILVGSVLQVLEMFSSGRFWINLLNGRVLITSSSAASSFIIYVLLQLLIVNVVMIAFNLLPAFPMDGGRVLRALLAMVMDHARATRVAAGVGQVMAVLFLIAGIRLPQPMLMFIALFVWVSARRVWHNAGYAQ